MAPSFGAAEFAVSGIDKIAKAGDHTSLRITSEDGEFFLKPVRKRDVIGIHPGDQRRACGLRNALRT